MTIRLSVLCENNAGTNGVLGEWGWSVLLEYDKKTILLDTGAGESVIRNARRMGIDLSKVDTIVLSHSHYDHTGGLRETLRAIGKEDVEVIAHPDIWAKKYNTVKNRNKFVGVPYQREELESLGARFTLVTDPYPITDSILTSGEIPMTTSFENESKPAFSEGKSSRYIIDETGRRKDLMKDDLAVMIKGTQGLVVVLGCAHRGVINTLYHARSITGVDKIHAVFGGAHLVAESDERIEKTIQVFKQLDVQVLGLCHCTGLKAVSRAINTFGDKFVAMNAGKIYEQG